jgi:hypothetical protein
MNLDLALLLASVALTVFLAAVGIEMANNPPTSRKAKWVYRSVFILLGTLLIGTTYWQGKRNIEEQARTRAESLREQQETKTQYDKVQGRLESIDRFVGHPPSGFTEKQIASVVRAMVKPTSKQSSEQPEVSQLLARQLAALSQDISDFEQDRKKGEDAFPPIDPSIPEGKSNEPWMIRQRYYGETKGKFHFARLDSRCGDLVDDVTTVEIMCREMPGNVTDLKRLSTYVAALAVKVQQPAN